SFPTRRSSDLEEPANLTAELRAAILRHPADPYLPLLGAALAWERQVGDPLPWLQRSLERSLANGRAHVLLAMVLHRHGALDQALLELRLAQEASETLVGDATRLALRWTQDPIMLDKAIPKNDEQARAWDALGAAAKSRALGAGCDERAIALGGTRVGPRERLVRDLVRAATMKTAPCGDRGRCTAVVERHIAAVAEHATDPAQADILRAEWLE